MEIQFDFFDDSLLLDIFIARIKRKISQEMPKLEHEPQIEYNEHIRAEVEYRAAELVQQACDKHFGKREERWKDS